MSPVVEVHKAGVGGFVIPPGLEDVEGGLHVLGRVGPGVLMDGQGVRLAGLRGLPQLRHAAGNFDCSHDVNSFRWVQGKGRRERAEARPRCWVYALCKNNPRSSGGTAEP